MSTPGLFRFSLRTAEILGLTDPEGADPRTDEDKAGDFDYQDRQIENYLSDVTGASNVGVFDESLQRGRELGTMPATTTYSSNAVFVTNFPATPRVVLTVECGRGQDMSAILTSVSVGGFGFKVTTATAGSTSTLFVHWVAVQA